MVVRWTGHREVLALANRPRFNPNATSAARRCATGRCSTSFEPGSTMKTFSLAGALEEERCAPGRINCENGAWAVGSHVIHDHKGMGWVGPARVMAASSNIGAAKVGQRLGRERLAAHLPGFASASGPGSACRPSRAAWSPTPAESRSPPCPSGRG